MGGSVRIPASFCGIVGLKPSFGRIPFTILPSQFDSLSHFGPLARTIDDAALFLDVTQGPDERDIQSLAPRLQIPKPIPDDIRGWRLALAPTLGFLFLDPEVEATVRSAAAALAERGAIIEEVDLGWTKEMNDAWGRHWGVYLASFFGHTLAKFRGKMDPNVVRLIEAGTAMSALDFKKIEHIRTDMWKKLSPILQRCHALLCPTMAHPAPKVGGQGYGIRLDRRAGPLPRPRHHLGLQLRQPVSGALGARGLQQRRPADRAGDRRPALSGRDCAHHRQGAGNRPALGAASPADLTYTAFAAHALSAGSRSAMPGALSCEGFPGEFHE